MKFSLDDIKIFIKQRKFNDEDYISIYEAKHSHIWKTQIIEYETPIYIRKELVNKIIN